MNSNAYPNRDALRKANDIYLDAMRSFIVHNLKQITRKNVQQLIEDALKNNQKDRFNQMFNEHNDISSAIDFAYIPHIIKKYWYDIFADKFDNNLNSQDKLWIIGEGRNKCEHRPAKDLDFGFTITICFHISEILNEINRSDKKNEVDEIRNQLLSDETTRQNSEINYQLDNVETENENNSGNELEYSEFWAPIRDGEGLFAGVPVPVSSERHISKCIRDIEICLHLNNHNCYIRLWLKGENRSERMDMIKNLFRDSEYEYEDKDTPMYATLIFSVLDKGKNDRDDWDEIREKLVNMGTNIYSIIDRSGL